jgi:small subunit ribosomal protein S3
MGRKIHPVGFRLKIIRDWDSRWFATAKDSPTLLNEDLKIRKFIMEHAGKGGQQDTRRQSRDDKKRDFGKNTAAISRIEIERSTSQITVWIHTARPGIVIGSKGDTVSKLKNDLEAKLGGKKVKVEVKEIDKPDLDAFLVAESIAGQLERRIGHSRAMKRAISQAMRQGAQGIKIMVNGRLGGSDMSRREWSSEGRIPRSTLRAYIDYATSEALTTFGRIGVKVWIYKGEVLKLEEKKIETAPVAP